MTDLDKPDVPGFWYLFHSGKMNNLQGNTLPTTEKPGAKNWEHLIHQYMPNFDILGRNPATGESLILAPRRVVTFKCSGKLRDLVNNNKKPKNKKTPQLIFYRAVFFKIDPTRIEVKFQ